MDSHGLGLHMDHMYVTCMSWATSAAMLQPINGLPVFFCMCWSLQASQTHIRAGVDRQKGSPTAWDVQNILTHVVQGSAVTQDSDSIWGMSNVPVWYFRSTNHQAALTRADSAASSAQGLWLTSLHVLHDDVRTSPRNNEYCIHNWYLIQTCCRMHTHLANASQKGFIQF